MSLHKPYGHASLFMQKKPTDPHGWVGFDYWTNCV